MKGGCTIVLRFEPIFVWGRIASAYCKTILASKPLRLWLQVGYYHVRPPSS